MRIDQITFTRFIAAISIVIYHFGINVFPFNSDLVSFLFKQANVGVSYFFILSGFVMIIAYGNKSNIKISDYFKSRFARIYPAYFLAMLILFVYVFIAKYPINYIELGLNLFVIQSWFPGKALSFNYPGWSLGVEFFFYAILPILLFVYKKWNYKTFVIPIIIFWILNQIILHIVVSSGFYHGSPSKSHDLLFYFPLMHLNEFLIGNLAGLFFVNKLKENGRNYDWLIIFFFALIVLALKFPIGLIYHNGLLALLFVPLILLIALNTGRLAIIFNKNIFIFLGEISYGIYIFQVPIYMYSRKLFFYLHIDNPLLKFYIYVVILISVSAISYKFIENPFRKYVKKYSDQGQRI